MSQVLARWGVSAALLTVAVSVAAFGEQAPVVSVRIRAAQDLLLAVYPDLAATRPAFTIEGDGDGVTLGVRTGADDLRQGPARRPQAVVSVRVAFDREGAWRSFDARGPLVQSDDYDALRERVTRQPFPSAFDASAWLTGRRAQPTGLQPNKAYFSQLPFEAIDMVNGGLMLTFTDLALPGDAGMDLRIVRSFSQQVNGGWWQMGIGGMPTRVEHPDGDGSGGDFPILVMADGGRHTAYPRDLTAPITVFVTDQFWRYTTTPTARTLEMPNGWKATYELGTYSGGAMLIEVEDAFGNTITPTWVGGGLTDIRPLKLASVTQSVGSTSRTVTFEYADPACPHTVASAMTYDGRTWTYDCEFASTNPALGPRLTAMTPPVGSGWQFDYVNGNGLDGALTVTTPRGGTIAYDFADQVLPSTDEIHRSVVASRVTGGRDIAPGTWTFAYEQTPTVPARGTVVGPFGRSVEFNSEWGAFQQKWRLAQKVLREGSAVVSTAERQYTDLGYTNRSDVAALPALDTLVQDGATYTVAYHYAGSNFGDYHQPWRLVESGQLTRTTERTFVEGFTPYLTNRLASETVTVAGGGSFTKSWDYDLGTGFLNSETVYGVTTSYAPDGRGNRASATDAAGRTTTFTYAWGVVEDTTTPEFLIDRGVNPDGTVAWETQGGATTFFDYDDLGRVSRVWPAAGDPIDHGYEGNGASEWVQRDPAWTTTFFDGFGRPTGTETAAGVRTQTWYDADGRKTFESLPYTGGSPGGGDYFEYDALNRVTRIDRPGGAWVGFTYTATTVQIRDENSHTTTQSWAAFGRPDDRRLVSVTDAAGKTWHYTYTALGGLTGVQQPDGPDRSWSYNSHHWVASETHPESGTTTYTHDNVGNVASKTIVGRGLTIEYGYDHNHRLTSIDAPGTAHDVTMTYDDRDNRRTLVNAAVSTTIDYDLANRPTQRTDVIDGESFVTSYGYDGRDNLETLTYPSGRVVSYSYDLGDRVTAVTGPSATWASSFGYHASGAVAGYTSGNGQTTSITYDARHRPDVLTSGPLSLDYAYDGVGNVTSLDDSRSGFSQTFGYDVVDRLTSVSGFGATTYTYDARGNRTAKGGTSYGYNGSDRLTSDSAQSYTYDGAGNMLAAGAQIYTYTPFNLVDTATVGGAVTTYWYDGDNQRRLRERPGGTKEYFVPGPGLVPLAEYRKASGGSRVLVREYIYAGDRLIASVGLEPSALPGVTWTDHPLTANVTPVKAVHLTELRDAVNAARAAHGLGAVSWTNATVAPGVLVIQPVHLTELRAAITAVYVAAGLPPSYAEAAPTEVRAGHLNELRAARTNAPGAEATTTRFYHLDALGSVRAVTSDTGAEVRRHDYAPFGEEPSPAPGADPRRFTGKERDAETGLDYFSARYYQNSTGRFTTVDPLMGTEIALTDPQRWNRYSYVGNRATRVIDPDGRGWVSKLVKLVAKGGDVAATFADVLESAQTLVDGNASLGDKMWAAASIGSEFLPVSIGDAKGAASFAVRHGDEAGGLRTTTHHILTDKNRVSTAAGGPYTPKFEAILDKAGMTLQDAQNKISIAGHRGPHAAYNRVVYERLLGALKGLQGSEYRAALERELGQIGRESATRGTTLNSLLTGGS